MFKRSKSQLFSFPQARQRKRHIKFFSEQPNKKQTDRQTDRQKAPNFKKYKVKYYTSLSQSYSSVSFSLAPPSEEVDTLEKKTPPEPALTPLRDSTTEIPSWRRADRQVRSGFTFDVPCLTALAMREDEEEGDERRRIWWRKSEISSGALAEVERSCWSWGWGAEVEDEQEDFLSYSYISPIITLQRDREREREKKNCLWLWVMGLFQFFALLGLLHLLRVFIESKWCSTLALKLRERESLYCVWLGKLWAGL